MNAFATLLHRHLYRVLPALLMLCAAGLANLTGADADEVECTSIRLQLAGDGYDQTCESQNGADVTVESLEANAVDGTHFLVIADIKTNFRYIFPGGSSLRKSLTDGFDSLTVEDWRTGKSVSGMTTAEFKSDYKTIPSDCVAFQGYFFRDRGGWRRHVIGFGCSRVGDRAQVYDALGQVNFPK